jgi:hypothetical protein
MLRNSKPEEPVMAENTENLVLEHLRAIRNDITAFRSETRAEMNNVKHRLGRIEEQIVGLRLDTVGA